MTRQTVAYVVRPARPADLPHLGPLEDSGLALFESALGDLTGTVLAHPADSGQQRAEKDGFLLVAAPSAPASSPAPDAARAPVGFAHVLFLDGYAHLEQLSVHPDHMRQGLGTALVEAACGAVERRGLNAITLMTYADLPWNAPFYAGLGFDEVGDDQKRLPYQKRLRENEDRLGLAAHGRRVLMRRTLRTHRTAEELAALLPNLDAAPKDTGTVCMVVRRPAVGVREVLGVGRLDPAVGLVGDTWAERGSSRTENGAAHPDMQLTAVSHPLIEFLAGEPDRQQLVGDQLHLDLDLSEANLPPRTRLVIGDPDAGPDHGAVIEVTDQPHTGCGKFIDRFGVEAMRFVNGPEGRPRRLRGLNARVVDAGIVRPGDRVLVVRPQA